MPGGPGVHWQPLGGGCHHEWELYTVSKRLLVLTKLDGYPIIREDMGEGKMKFLMKMTVMTLMWKKQVQIKAKKTEKKIISSIIHKL